MKQYKLICECWDKSNKKTLKEYIDPISLTAGVGGVILRNKRQRIVFNKVMEKFPTAKDMCLFLTERGLNSKSLTPEMSQYEYASWVKYQIVKQGHFWRIIGQILGFGIPGGIYNGIKYMDAKDKGAEEIVNDALT